MPKHLSKKRASKKNVGVEASQEWAQKEFATLWVKDPRRVKRFKKMAGSVFERPGSSIPQACGDWKNTKGAYRLLESGRISPEQVFESHRDALNARILGSGEATLLVAQDTTALNFCNRANTRGLGPIGNKAQSGRGMFVHSSLCVGAGGEVFGVLDARMYARDPRKFKAGPAGARNRKPIEEKESHRWLESYRRADALFDRLGGSARVVSVADREGDIYEAFALCEQRKASPGGGADLLVRSQHNRVCLGGQGQECGSWEHVEEGGIAAEIAITVPRSPGKRAREARLALYFGAVELKAPAHKTKYLGLEKTLNVHLVVVREIDPPQGAEAVCWRLWTSVEVTDARGAAEMVAWYGRRWLIEEMHRILKSGCKVEERQLESLEKLSLLLCLDLIVAAHLLGLSKAARTRPEASVNAWLEPAQWQALYCYTHKTNRPPTQPPGLMDAVIWIARLGGFLNRRSDGFPGAQTLWRGMQRLEDITTAYCLFKNNKNCG